MKYNLQDGDSLPPGTYRVLCNTPEMFCVESVLEEYASPSMISVSAPRKGHGKGSVYLVMTHTDRRGSAPLLSASRIDLLKYAKFSEGLFHSDIPDDRFTQRIGRIFFRHPDARRYRLRLILGIC